MADPLATNPLVVDHVAKVLSQGSGSSDYFGFAVGVDGDTALVRAHLDDDNGDNAGAAYFFGRDVGGADNWGQIEKITASDGSADDHFGWSSVALDDDTALVGAYLDDDNGDNAGAAYFFGRDVGGAANWGQTKKLPPAMGLCVTSSAHPWRWMEIWPWSGLIKTMIVSLTLVQPISLEGMKGAPITGVRSPRLLPSMGLRVINSAGM
ncbi:MAG: FG-GAP repeat protein [Chloroflexota bacterium]